MKIELIDVDKGAGGVQAEQLGFEVLDETLEQPMVGFCFPGSILASASDRRRYCTGSPQSLCS